MATFSSKILTQKYEHEWKGKNWLNKMEIVSQEFEVTEEQGGFCPLYLSSVA